MASELRVNTLKDASGNNSVGMSYVANGSAKAWASLNGSTFGLRDSFGISSANDDGTGDYTLNFSNSFSSINYGGSAIANNFTTFIDNEPTASAFNCGTRNSSNTSADSSFVMSQFHGDLA